MTTLIGSPWGYLLLVLLLLLRLLFPQVTIGKGLKTRRVVRTMPNTPAVIRQGMTVWFPTEAVGKDDHALAQVRRGGEERERRERGERERERERESARARAVNPALLYMTHQVCTPYVRTC